MGFNVFNACSSHEAVQGCVSCIDGYFLEINQPVRLETGNVKSYLSGHYCCYGINAQTSCDHLSIFVYVSVVAPGS